VLRRAFDDGSVVLAVESTGRWLEEFHPRSVVELDYAGLVDLRSDEQLRDDDSAGDIAEALAALAAGDSDAAGEAYDRVLERWREAQRWESAN
jgi:DNA-binding GntR family transcriptional regulator